MRFRGAGLFSRAALSVLLLTGLSACSGQQQSEEGLEVGQEGEASQDEATAQNGEEGGDNQAATNEEGADANAANEEATNNEEGGDQTADANNTENDLQEIIQEMNGQPAADGAEAAPAQPAPINTAAQSAPIETAAAPAAAPAPAPAVSEGPTLPFQPGGSPAGAGLPELGSKMAYVVQHGDTLGKISGKIYGNNNRWKELATLSGLANPSRIFPGDLVYYTLDESAVAFATAYEQVQRSEEQVKPGDTLATIAVRVYGDSHAWRSIWRQNDNIDNPDVIPPGTSVFYIPKGALSAAVTKVRAEMAKLAKTTNGIKISNNAKAAKSSHVISSAKTLKTLNSVHMASSYTQLSASQVNYLN